MTDRGTGGTGGSRGPDATDVDLEALRLTNPRRAARLAEARRRDQVFDQESPAPTGTGGTGGGAAVGGERNGYAPPAVDRAQAQPVADPGYPEPVADPGDAQPVAERGYAETVADRGDTGYAEPVGDAGYAEPVAGPGYAEPVRAPAAYDQQPAYVDDADPFGGPAPSEVFGDPVDDGYVPVVERGVRSSGRPRWVGLLTLLLVVGVVGGAGWFAYQALRPVLADIQAFDLFQAPEDFVGTGTGSVEVVVAQGDSGAEIGGTLLDAGVVASVEAFVAAANANPDFTSVQPGTYTVPQQLPAVDAVTALLDPANRVTDTLVIAEGLRVEQILDRLAEGTGIPREELQAALDATELPAGAREVQGLINPAEGFLYPDGYQFGENPTAADVISAMITRGQEELTRAGVPPEQQLTVLTKASLVQGEARLDEDFGKVAQVVENRLAIDQPLGLDSTVNYATQTFDTRTTAEQRASDSPYNTYVVAGLPPGPIKSPGRQAIEAVVSPTPGPWLYFVTVDLCTGQTAFAESYEEHLDNVDVLDAWQRENTDDDGTLVCG